MKVSQAHSDLIKRVLDDYDMSWWDKLPHTKEWLRLWLYIDGSQNITITDTLDVFQRTSPDGNVDYDSFSENRFGQMMRVWLSKITSGLPMPKVSPAADTRNSYDISRTSSMLVRWLWQQMRIQENQLVDFGRWFIATGNAVSKFVWENNPSTDTGFSDYMVTSLYQDDMPGFLSHEVVSMFHIFVAPGAKSFNKSPWYIQTHVYTMEAFKEKWGEARSEHEQKGSQLQPYVVTELDDPKNRSRQTRLDNYVLVFECFYRATEKNPKGEYIVLTENQVLDHKGKDNLTRELFIPFRHYSDLKTTHHVWGTSMLRDAVPQQDKLNHVQQRIMKALDLVAAPPLLDYEGSTLDRAQMKPGGYLTVQSPGMEPRVLDLNIPIPMLEGMSTNARQDFSDTGGQHMVSQGSAQGSSQSGRAIALLVEQDEQRLGLPKLALSAFLRDAGEMYLRLWKANMPYEVTISLVGEEFGLDYINFYGSEINSFVVQFEDSSVLLRSERYHRQQLKEDLQYGAITPEEYKLAISGKPEAMNRNEDYYDAREELSQLKRGIAVVPMWYEDHKTHLEVVIGFMKSVEFRKLPQHIQMVVDEHAKAHYQEMQRAQAEQQMMMQQMEQEKSGAAKQPNINAAAERQVQV